MARLAKAGSGLLDCSASTGSSSAASPGLRRSEKASEDPIGNPVGAWVVTVTRYIALVALYGGIILVVRDQPRDQPQERHGEVSKHRASFVP